MQVRMLKRGMEGADVKTLQAALIAYGFPAVLPVRTATSAAARKRR